MANSPVFWHDGCWCPDDYPGYPERGQRDVTYCPAHGVRERIISELGEPVNCGCPECHDTEQAEADRRRSRDVMTTPDYFFDLPGQSAQEWIDRNAEVSA